jgi:hypothetical protein
MRPRTVLHLARTALEGLVIAGFMGTIWLGLVVLVVIMGGTP